ncbi:MAG: hypothetical protein RLZ54_488 [Candidatus Parcubacteria bacterium]|jgi:hypothetical protein
MNKIGKVTSNDEKIILILDSKLLFILCIFYIFKNIILMNKLLLIAFAFAIATAAGCAKKPADMVDTTVVTGEVATGTVDTEVVVEEEVVVEATGTVATGEVVTGTVATGEVVTGTVATGN